ncbi:Oxygen tolerance [Thiocapsa roseopersicina]|uniref:Oxygen tolerance n=2 Tax=Thiocapsa roseopersicina TaxID=1058 RepID=A0A1H2ZM35_THIRO|nr:Oxygen tolerance [Thiocapsa roseopersicina]
MVMRIAGLRRPTRLSGPIIPGPSPMPGLIPGLILGLMLALCGQAASAWPYAPPGQQPFQPQGPYGQPPPQAGAWQFRPQAPTNAQGTPPAYPQGVPPAYPPGQMRAPGYGQFPGQMPNQMPRQYPGQYRTQAQVTPPRLEATLDEPEPYVQQPLLLRLRLVTSENPGEATLDLPATGDALLQRVDGPTPESRSAEGGRREIVNTFILSLIPLRPGDIEIPPIKVTGTVRGMGGGMQRFESVTDRPIRLRVRPAMSAVTPWLPLKSLSLKAEIDRETDLAPGQPVTLALELLATGGTAAQLPSLEDQLAGPDHRVYREQVLTESGLSADRSDLVARRTEYYTLVPQSSGRLALPEIGVPWWNTGLGTREVATLPMRTLSIGGESGPFGMPSSVMSAEDWSVVWLPLTGLLLLLAGYWGGVIYATKPQTKDRPRARTAAGLVGRLSAFGALIGNGWNRVGRRLRPAPLVARMRAAAAAALPPSSRFLLCVRHANRAADPIDWCDRFEADARSRLRFQGEATQPNLTRLILSLRPHADPATLTRLMQELDAALYGRQGLDFARWKRDFMRQVGRGAGLRPRKSRVLRIKRAALPALNPGR